MPAYTSVLAWHIAWHQRVSLRHIRGSPPPQGLHQNYSPDYGRITCIADEHVLGFLSQFGVDVHILYVIRRLTELLECPLIQVSDQVVGITQLMKGSGAQFSPTSPFRVV